MKNRSAFSLLALGTAAALAISLAACGGNESATTGDSSSQGNESAPLSRLSALSDSSEGQPFSADSVDSAGAPTAAPRAGASSSGSGVSGAGGSGGTGDAAGSASFDRKITRNASLELAVDNVLDAVQKVEDIATSAGGFVSNSSLAMTDTQDGEGIQTATVKIRVPADSYAGIMSKLRGVAKEVRSESSDTQEVTAEYTDLQSRLRNLQATEQRYLDLLARASTINDILTVQDRLSTVRGDIEQVLGRINVLDDLTDLATISVKLELPAVVQKTEEESHGWVRGLVRVLERLSRGAHRGGLDRHRHRRLPPLVHCADSDRAGGLAGVRQAPDRTRRQGAWSGRRRRLTSRAGQSVGPLAIMIRRLLLGKDRQGGELATRSAAKAHRQSVKRRIRNRAIKSATKTAVKNAGLAIAGGEVESARLAVRGALIALDKATAKGVIHPNNAARRKSRLLLKYNAAIAALQVPGEEKPAPKRAARGPAKAAAKKAPARKTKK